MEGMKRKKKSFEFAEGHKRETRKSYQSFIERTGKSSSSALDSCVKDLNIKSEDLGDDGVRKSSRKPVPKKSFELVDVFDKKSPLVKHISNKPKSHGSTQGSMQEFEMVKIKEEPIDDDFDSAPRKSNRVPVPKKSFDLIDPKLRGGMSTSQQDNVMKANMEVKMQKKSKKAGAEKVNSLISGTEVKLCDEKTKKKPEKGGKNVDNLAVALLNKQQQDFEKSEKSKFTLKLDFRAKKDKGSRKRKLTKGRRIISSNQSPDDNGAVEPNAKVAKVVEDNIDKSDVMEALQALNQPPSNENALTEEPMLMKDAIKLEETNVGIEDTLLSPEKGWDYSRSTTEISDGHVILKLGGLNSPNKPKKHKKKHKHGHHSHKAGLENEEVTKRDTESHANLDDMNMLSKTQDVQHQTIFSGESNVSSKQIPFQEESKGKQGKNHRKRKLLQNKTQESSVKVVSGTTPEENELIVKKRKIYKKKKGEKILLRIQTEFWSKSGELVKVEPMHTFDGMPSQAKDKEMVKQKKLQTVASKTIVSRKQLNAHSMKNASDVSSLEVNKESKRDQESKPKAKKKTKTLLATSTGDLKKNPSKAIGSKSKASTSAKKGINSTIKKKKERKTQTLTAYLLYCRKYRPKVVHENPDIGFSEISKKLAQMWNEAPEKEKDIYKKQLEEHRAKVNATIRKETSKKLKTTKQMGQLSPFKCDNTQVFSGRMSSREYKIAPQKYSVVNLEPLDMGAHLQLLGESLMLVGSALRRQIFSKPSELKVYGSLSVLLDSSLCAMAPLLFLTSCVPELDVIPPEIKANTLDNIAYILPGL